MDECNPQLLSSYLDGELPPDDRVRVESHLANCHTCRAQLKQLSATSGLIQSVAVDPLTPDEVARLHQAIDDAGEQSILRLGMIIGALAASVMIVAGAWLMELPRGGAGGPTGPVVAASEPWERVAITLQVDPSLTPVNDPIQVADADLARWMLDGLAGANR